MYRRRYTVFFFVVIAMCFVLSSCGSKSEITSAENTLNRVTAEETGLSVGEFTDEAVMYEYSVSEDITEMELQLEACQGGSRVEMISIVNIVLADQSGSKGYIILYPEDEKLEEYNYQLFTEDGKAAGSGAFPMSGLHEEVNIALLPEVTMVCESGNKNIKIVPGTSLILMTQKCTSPSLEDIDFRVRVKFK